MVRPGIASEEFFRLDKQANGDLTRATISNPCDSTFVDPDISCDYNQNDQAALGSDVGKLQSGRQWIKTVTYNNEDVAQFTYASKQDMCDDSMQTTFQRLWFCEHATEANPPNYVPGRAPETSSSSSPTPADA